MDNQNTVSKNEEFCLFKIDQKRVIWEVTNYCNYHCKHCCASATKVDTADELSTERFLSMLDELKEFGVKEIYFSGGEPFSRKDILTILKRARKNGITCNISTNGSFLTDDLAEELEKLHLNKVHISLDSYIEDDFNDFRGGDYFNPTVNAIKLLKKHNLYVRVGTVIWTKNINYLEEMVQFLIDLGVNEVVFNWLVKVGRLVENNDVCVDIKFFDETIKKIQGYMKKYEGKIKISMHRHEPFCESEKICPAGETFFYIDPKGYISPCSWIKKMDSSFTAKKSLKEASFKDIIKSNEIQNFNNMKRERNERYKTGCPAICLERNHTYFAKDPLLSKDKNLSEIKKDKGIQNSKEEKEECLV